MTYGLDRTTTRQTEGRFRHQCQSRSRFLVTGENNLKRLSCEFALCRPQLQRLMKEAQLSEYRISGGCSCRAGTSNTRHSVSADLDHVKGFLTSCKRRFQYVDGVPLAGLRGRLAGERQTTGRGLFLRLPESVVGAAR